MNCPYCAFPFKAFTVNAAEIPDVAPLVCEGCAEVSLLIDRVPYRTTPEQLAALKQSPAWRDMIAPAQQIIRRNLEAATAVPAVDRTKTTLTDGSPVTPDHRAIDPRTGQQRGYVVLSAEERARGFVRPLRRTYTHVGSSGPKYPLRDLTPEEKERHADRGYVKFELYPESESPTTGRYWTQAQLDRHGRGCGGDTSMGVALAVWQGTSERLGS